MNKSSHNKKTIAGVSDDTRLTLINESTNNQRPAKNSFLLSDTFIIILLGIVALLFILIIVLVIISGLQSYTNLNSFDRHLSDKNNNKSVSEIVRTTALASTTIIMKTILPEQDVSKPAIKDSGLPQALYIQDDFVAADDD